MVTEKSIQTRGQRLWERMLNHRNSAKVSLARAKLLTASYKETEGLPAPIRRAKAFEKIVTEIPIYIEDDDILAGSFATSPMYFEWYPEYEVDPEIVTKDANWDLSAGYSIEDVRDIVGYWKERCLERSYFASLSEEQRKKIAETCDDGAWVYRTKSTLNVDRGYHAMDYTRAINRGFLDILAEVEHELQITPVTNVESFEKANILKGLEIVLKAGIQYSRRHANLARELAAKATGERRLELEKIAEACDWVPDNPARTFFEAVQISWFVHMLASLESRAQESPGRMDQYLYPYYKQDIEKGILSKEDAVDILECLRVKMSTLRQMSSAHLTEIISGEAQYHNVTLGGQTSEGEDATNELSFLFLEAAFRTRTPHHTISIRWHRKLNREFAIKALELIRLGLGFPAFFNDDAAIPWLLTQGVPLEKARSYCLSGCVQHTIPGETSPLEALFISMPKCLELAFNNGIDPRTGNKVGLATGKLTDFQTYDDVLNSFKSQVRHASFEGGAILADQRAARSEMLPTMFASAFVDNCIKRGSNILGNGPRYFIAGQTCLGMVDVANSLAAVKKLIFEEKTLSKEELMDALQSNFLGKDNIRQLLLAAPKFGNDNRYVDNIAADLYTWWWHMVSEINASFGTKYLPTPYSVSAHAAAGKRVGALPSGRLAGVALADGSVSPVPGTDSEGPTAVINSAGSIDQIPMFGTLLNIKFHPTALRSLESLNKLNALIKTYFDYGGKHIQFNVVDANTLKDAQVHPELHRNLIVRVAGYSALFNELSRNVQDEIIARTEHVMR